MTDASDPTPEGQEQSPNQGTDPAGAFEVQPGGGASWQPATPPSTTAEPTSPGHHPGFSPNDPPPTWRGTPGATQGADPTWPGTTPGADPTWPGSPGATPGADPTWPGTPGAWPQAGGWQSPHGGWAPPSGGGWAPPGAGWVPSGTGWAPSGAWTPPPPRQTQPMRRSRVFVLGAAVAAGILLLGTGLGYAIHGSSPSTNAAARTPSSGSAGGSTPFGRGSSPGTTSGRTSTSGSTSGSSGSGGRSSAAAGSPSNISSIAATIEPELVDINTKLKDENEAAAGTGMVLTSDGLILTNNHVIDGATTITATDIGNGKTYTATVVGYDRSHDVAVIQLKDASGLKTVSLGDSSKVATGEGVVGIGNAGGVGGTPSTAGGSVTALNQSITASDEGSATSEHLTGLIETNCGIEPGDSGGPLVSTSDQVVGMDTAASESSGRAGAFAHSTTTTASASGNQGYSIPINEAITLAKKIEAGDSTATIHIGTTAFLGVEVTPAGSSSTSTSGTHGRGGSTGSFGTGFFSTRTSSSTSSSNTSSSGSSTSGADVAGVVAGTPATKAGLGKGDVITTFGGTSVTSSTALTSAINGHHPGDHVKVTWVDSSGQQHSATVTLANGPAA
jgi:S1-C subfamily serine protease